MKSRKSNIFIIFLFLVGLGVLLYPTIADQWNTYKQERLITEYQEKVSEKQDFSDEWGKAQAFNDSLEYNALYSGEGQDESIQLEDTEYWKVLNIAGDGVMGYITIPKIGLELAIYHGVGDDILQTGVGHVSGSNLPIGGETTHCVLPAHKGLPSARLFTDIDQLEKGDKIYIHVLDQVLAYEVDQVQDMIDKDDSDTLGKALDLQEGKDLITLFTCTPYGINSHRLLVRGIRVEYNGELDADNVSEGMLESVQDYYMIYLLIGAATVILFVIIGRNIKIRIQSKNKDRNISKEEKEEEERK